MAAGEYETQVSIRLGKSSRHNLRDSHRVNRPTLYVECALATDVKDEGCAFSLSQKSEDVQLIGRSPVKQDVCRVLARLTQTDLTVMFTGEYGTINMDAIPRELMESELFGDEKGAFTGRRTDTSAASGRSKALRSSSARSATCR